MRPQFRIAAKIGETVWDCKCGERDCASKFVKEFYVCIHVLDMNGNLLGPVKELGPFETKEDAQHFLQHLALQVRSGNDPSGIKICEPEMLH
jgi:hypothetical protein